MEILPSGAVRLQKGEVMPVKCEGCERLYQPERGSFASKCPNCGHGNIHSEQQGWKKL